jgi:aldehyde:ferredoxin oxidoreductase
MECFQRGILSVKDLDGLELKWGDYHAMASLIKKIAQREGVGALLAEGSARAAAEIGGDAGRYAMHVKGLEIPGYDPRGAIGMALAYAVADRGGCHLRAWTIYDEVVGEMDRFAAASKALLVASRINRKALMDSIGMCEVMGLSDHYAGLLEAATGWKVEMKINKDLPGTFIEDFLIEGDSGGIGRRISNLTRAFNIREGLGKKDDQLPARYYEETVTEGPVRGHAVSRADFEKMREEFYSICGWDENGVPTRGTLTQLGLGKAAEDLWPES